MRESLSIRVDAANPDHHLWVNGDSWWIHYTVHTDDGRARRVRYSLETRDREQARMLRDAIFAAWTEPGEHAPQDLVSRLLRAQRLRLPLDPPGDGRSAR